MTVDEDGLQQHVDDVPVFQLFKPRKVTPDVSGEIFYDTRYRVWN